MLYIQYSEPISKVRFLISIYQLGALNENITHTEILLANSGNEIKDVTFDYVNENYQSTRSTFNDLLTTYNVYLNRLYCMRLNPSYAKDMTLDLLTRYQIRYNEFITSENINIKFKLRLIAIYSQLYISKYAFNIMDRSDLTKLVNIETNIQEIKEDIVNMFETIRQKILQL